MNSFYFQVIIPIAAIDSDILSDLIFSNDGMGIETNRDYYICSFGETFNSESMNEILSNYLDIKQIKIVKKESENWMESWKENFQPIEIGDSFLIKPSWVENKKTDRITIEIDPKMAFGTGTHETTQLILEQLPFYQKKGNTVLDVGTGSGILAITSEKLGALKVIAIDNDPVAIENCQENIKLNQCVQIDATTTTIEQISGAFDLVIANINRNILLEIVDDIIQRLNESGILILSGLLIQDKEPILDSYKSIKFIKSIDKGEWTCMVFKR